MRGKNGKIRRSAVIAVVILTAALLGAAYFFLVDRPVRSGIREADEERAALESRLNLVKAFAGNVSDAADEVESITAAGNTSWMPSYNSEAAELDMLHNLLNSRTYDYNVSLAAPTRDGNQIRRGCSLTFDTWDYETAKEIIHSLNHGRYRCLISSTTVSGITEVPEDGVKRVNVDISATFYETMMGGEPDMGLAEGDRGRAQDPMEIGLSGDILSDAATVRDIISGGGLSIDAMLSEAGG